MTAAQQYGAHINDMGRRLFSSPQRYSEPRTARATCPENCCARVGRTAANKLIAPMHSVWERTSLADVEHIKSFGSRAARQAPTQPCRTSTHCTEPSRPFCWSRTTLSFEWICPIACAVWVGSRWWKRETRIKQSWSRYAWGRTHTHQRCAHAGPMDGLALAAWARTKRPDVKVVLISGELPPSAAMAADMVFSKPVHQASFLTAVMGLLGDSIN